MKDKQNIDAIIDIAQNLGLQDTYRELEFLKSRLDSPNKDLIMPLVGEFSSGKTSLINALTDNKQLETASKATTATIFEIRFECERCYAEIVNSSGEVLQVEENIANLKNDGLQDVDLVRVYDTSSRVHAGTVLVDTPGLSSNDARHKLALTSYLPHADAILLLTDVNQQVTRSLIDFIDNTKLVNKPMYLVITKCDTKTKGEVEAAKKYIAEDINLPLENMISVSAYKDDLQELYDLFGRIQRKKNEIVEKAVYGRIKSIASDMSEYVDELIRSSKSDLDIDEKILGLQEKLQSISRNIEKLIRDASLSIADKGEDCKKRFSDNVFMRLDSIVKNQGRDCDEAVYTAVNMIAKTALEQYKKDVQYVLVNMARERQRTVEEVPLQVLEALDLSGVVLNNLSYNLNLSALGHQYDQLVGGVVKTAAVVATVWAGASALSTAGKAATAANTVDRVADVVDTATDAASIASNIKTRSRMKEMIKTAKEYSSKINKQMDEVESWNNKMGERYQSNRGGIIDTGVSWITDQFWGKPQRRRAVNNYISDSLVPEFVLQIEQIRSELVRTIGQLLHDEAQNRTLAMEQSLNQLKADSASAKEQFKEKVNQLKEYKNILKNG